MKHLSQLLNKLRNLKLFRELPTGRSQIQWLQHLEDTIDHLREDKEELLEWLDTSIRRSEFLATKYRGEAEVEYYTSRVRVLKRLKTHLEVLLTPGSL